MKPKRQKPEPEPRKDLEMMQDQDRWPLWPVLPVKRRRDGNMPEVGMMFAGKPTVILENISALYDKSRPRDWKKIEYKTYEAVIVDGWVVD